MTTSIKQQKHLAWTQIIEKLSLANDEHALSVLMNEWVKPGNKSIVAFVNAHAMNLAHDSTSFAHDLSAADYLLRDGSGMAMLLKWLNRAPGLNLNGTDLIPLIAEETTAKSIALIGTQSPYLEQAANVLKTKIGSDKTIVTIDGFKDAEAYILFCQQHQPELIVLGMGMPKQERIAQQLKANLTYSCLIVCGGAIIDFWGGKVSRAPLIIRKLNIEWIYRLMLEPKRLFKRYVMGNPLFIARARAYLKKQNTTV